MNDLPKNLSPTANEHLNQLKQARPYLRTALAFLWHLRTCGDSLGRSYQIADDFINELEKDVEQL